MSASGLGGLRKVNRRIIDGLTSEHFFITEIGRSVAIDLFADIGLNDFPGVLPDTPDRQFAAELNRRSRQAEGVLQTPFDPASQENRRDRGDGAESE